MDSDALERCALVKIFAGISGEKLEDAAGDVFDDQVRRPLECRTFYPPAA
jgi:hypothetical protein